MNNFNLAGKTAMVTGGSRGLGKAMAEGLMNAGAEVVIMGINPRVSEIADGYKKQGFKCHGLTVDLGNDIAREESFEQALALLNGGIDILVNSAGIQRRYKFEEFPIEDWNDVIRINLTATFGMCQLAGRVMLKNKSGKIINIASMLSFFGGYTVAAYAASKGGVAQLTKALSNEWAGRGVNVNAIAPGYMDTEMNTALINDPVRTEKILSRIPAGRWGTPKDLVGPMLFLASEESNYLHGAIIPVDGGYLAN